MEDWVGFNGFTIAGISLPNRSPNPLNFVTIIAVYRFMVYGPLRNRRRLGAGLLPRGRGGRTQFSLIPSNCVLTLNP